MLIISKSISHQLLILLLCTTFSAASLAESLLRDDHPKRYTVQKGDTLWDISGRFLRSPWRWPDIWHVNPQVANPHLIYPGDELELVYINGKPQLRMKRGNRTVKLSPNIRSTPWDGSIPTIPIDAIAPFLSRPYVLEEGQLENAPYIVQFADEHVLGGAGQRAYVRSLPSAGSKYDVVRPGDAYKDSESGEILGYEATYIGNAEATRAGDPATIFFNSTVLESVIGDRLLRIEHERAMANFIPKAPSREVSGAIISVLNGVSQIGQFNVVVLDRGSNDGVDPGTVLRIDQRGETIRDTVTPDSRDTVTLPDEQAGTLMVFRSFERVSFGLVLDATKVIHVNDRVLNP